MQLKEFLMKNADPVTEEALRMTADVIGPNAAAHGVLKEIEERRAKGEEPVCYVVGNQYIVFNAKEQSDVQGSPV